MSTPTVERTGDWDSVSFAGGYAGLHDLADDEFSGTVTAGPARLFMLRGSVIGILDGDIEDFEEAGGTAREAPHPALPLLAVMQERSDEVRAEYYTEETPISEVDRTLSDGNFTGYIELSENVLSGDYYQVYHQGHSMSVAYVGASERLIEDDEAFEQADDEVGIYEVRPVDIEVIEIPEPAGEESAGAGAAESGAAGATAGGTNAASAIDDEAATGSDDGAIGSDDGATETGDETTGADDETTETDEAAAETASATADSEAGAAGAADGSDATEPASDDQGDAEAPTTDAEAGDGGGSATDDSAADVAEPSDGDTTTTDSGDGSTAARSASSEGADSEGRSEPTVDEPATDRAATQEPTADGTSTADANASADPPSGNVATEPGASAQSTEPREGDTGTAPDDAASTGGTRRGEPAPDHPAAASRGGSRQRTGEPGGDGAGGALAPGDLEMRSLPSLDPERSASASKQERQRRSATGSAAASGAAAGSAGAAAGAATDQPQEAVTESDSTDSGAASRSGPAAAEHDRPDAGAARDTVDEPAGEPSADASTNAAPDASDPATTDDSASSESTSGESDRAEDSASSAGGSTAAAADLEDAEAEAERLESELESLQDEHEDVVAERDRLESELAEAREEIERLRDRLEATGQVGEAATKLSPREAIDETNLFIRYDSKGEATLEKAHSGEADKDAVDENLRLEYHTSFDADDASVDGVDFDKFLTETVQYRFVDWIVRTLLYEIRDTGNTGPMAELYDALPKVDRAELNGQVTVKYTEDGEEHRSQIGFDVIVRDRMGNPLIVANLNDSRDPATESMMTDLVRSAERVGETSSSLAGGFLVTRSFFEPEALETAEEATAGGLLSRGKQKSFVNLSRKGGYHLCLVEARNDEFHLAVPEL